MRTDDKFLALVADYGCDSVTSADVLVVPGGFATRASEADERVLEWIRSVDATTQWTTSVCTGSMLLAAAGLLEGKEATTHWASLHRLAEYGAIPTGRRVVEQGKIVTAAGVSAGIDMGLTLAARIAGDEYAQGIQLGIEYDPQPPFDAGSLDKAPAPVAEFMTSRFDGRRGERPSADSCRSRSRADSRRRAASGTTDRTAPSASAEIPTGDYR